LHIYKVLNSPEKESLGRMSPDIVTSPTNLPQALMHSLVQYHTVMKELFSQFLSAYTVSKGRGNDHSDTKQHIIPYLIDASSVKKL
jgi:phage-related protein